MQCSDRYGGARPWVVAMALLLHFALFARQFNIQIQCAQYATYNSLGVCSKARSALTTVPYKEKWEKE